MLSFKELLGAAGSIPESARVDSLMRLINNFMITDDKVVAGQIEMEIDACLAAWGWDSLDTSDEFVDLLLSQTSEAIPIH